jgi:hypothetical protein
MTFKCELGVCRNLKYCERTNRSNYLLMDHPVPVDGCSLGYSIEVRAGNKKKIFRLLIFTTENLNHYDRKITENN